MTLFVEISLIVVVATLVSLVTKFLRQPLVVGYIAAGVLVGPYALNILQAHQEVELFSKIGVAILLFIVGLMLNPDVMREVGKVSVTTGVGQVILTSLIGFLIIYALGFETITALYVAVALTFSSTIIILKLLSDKGDIQKLYGKIAIGLLLVQDVIAVIFLLAITVLGKFVAGYQEVLFIFSLAWGLGISSLFYTLGFSIEIGALVAGVTLAASPAAYEIASRMKPLRDFFIMLFFILLGSQIIISEISVLLMPAVVLSVFVLVGNPLIVFVLMNLLGYRARTAFLVGLTVAQISEFSLILVALGYSLGHLSQEAVSLVTLVGIITISGSTYLILYADQIYSWLKPILKFLIIRRSHMLKFSSGDGQADIIIFGYDRVGFDFVKAAREISQKYLVVDFNPRSIARLAESKIPYRYGDAEDVEFLEEINVAKAQLVISTIPDLKTNLLLVNYYRSHNSAGIIMTISHSVESTQELYEAGASYVVMPHYLGASHAASLISKHRFDRGAFENEKARHLESLVEYKK
ncbi:MAG: Transporter, CPA2 family [Parcubacteria group bacterium GW2011_GWA2_47_64]|nr:MAG: Transporter, CPA2 family [Parcubacteria group bacterium GW2011_GWA2_47_64]